MEMESFKINKALLERIRRHVKGTRQTITGYIELSLTESIQLDEFKKKSPEILRKLKKQ